MKQIFLGSYLDTKLVFIIYTVLQTLFMNCSILLHSLERKIKKWNFEKISNCKKIILPPLPPKKNFHHYYCIIFPTFYLPAALIEFPPWRNISKKFRIFFWIFWNFFCKKFERIFCFKATCDCEACCYDKFLNDY